MKPNSCPICPDECRPEYHAASASIRKWLRERLRLVLTPFEIGKPKHPASAPFTPLSMIGHIPERPKREYPPCTVCGGKHYARGKCKPCYGAAKSPAARAPRAQPAPEVAS